MTTKTQMTEVGTVFVTVRSQDEALAFYVGTLGFEQIADFEYADGRRWVEVSPRGDGPRIALVTRREGEPPPGATGIAIGSSDIEADHADLRERGVDVDEIVREGGPLAYWGSVVLAGIPPMFVFRDPDGNAFLVVQAA